MAEGRERSEWNRAASIIVKLHNTHAVHESQLITFQSVHPFFAQSRSTEPTVEELEIAKRAIEGYSAAYNWRNRSR